MSNQQKRNPNFETRDISNSWFYVEEHENGKYIISDGND